MIETLRIDGLAIVDRIALEFGAGLNVLTGETGAGKSVVLGALSLLAGGRAAADGIRDGRDDASVEAVFSTAALPELEAELERRGFALRDHELVVRRALSRAGRSRAQLCGELVPAGALAELFADAIEISSQHDSQALLRPEVHGRLLDGAGGLLSQRRGVEEGFAEVRRIDEELAALRAEVQERTRRRDFLAFQIREIDAAELAPGELASLRAERSRLAHAGRLRDEGAVALAALAGDSLGGDDEPNAADLLGETARRLADLVALDPDLGDLAARVEAAGADVRDAALTLEQHLDRIESDPARLAGVEERLHTIERLQHKYGESVEFVLRFRDEAAAELASIEGAGEREAALVGERETREKRLAADAVSLSKSRARVGRRLARTVEASLRELAMKEARFEVALEPAPAPAGMPCGPSGCELPDFRFSANAGEALRPLRRVASGGELSRVFLALKGAVREAASGMVLVFDEVDAGVGGRAADRIGRALAELAGHHQVLCITHLPQIAAFADTHFRVEKRTRKGRADVRIERVEGGERVEEIARMAAGERVGEATRRHARELLHSRS